MHWMLESSPMMIAWHHSPVCVHATVIWVCVCTCVCTCVWECRGHVTYLSHQGNQFGWFRFTVLALSVLWVWVPTAVCINTHTVLYVHTCTYIRTQISTPSLRYINYHYSMYKYIHTHIHKANMHFVLHIVLHIDLLQWVLVYSVGHTESCW